MYSLYKIHKDKLMLNPDNGKPFKTMLSVRRHIRSLKYDRVDGKFIVTQSELDKWNNAVRVINGM